MAELLLIVRLAGRRIALPAHDVEAVVELDGLTPAPGAADHVAGLSALRSRVLTVIDGIASLGLGRADPQSREAIVVPSEGHTYALLVEEVEDVVEAVGAPVPVKAPIGRGWDRVGIGMVEAGGDLLLLVNPHLLIAAPAAQAA
ncbi:MAG TPA: chemotaxis protein CheW [Allosphingosinicella sp.]|nr:chemotaxis protein CheW [Allosphingosinicella sp.]